MNLEVGKLSLNHKTLEMFAHKKIVVGIDATNLRRGGGRTHLIELLSAVNPDTHNILRIVVWGGSSTLALLEDRPWLEKQTPFLQEQGLLARTFWQRVYLSEAARRARCDVLFVPGGTYSGDFYPVVTMSRNMLPFERQELRRYGWSLTAFRYLMLRFSQSKTFLSASGVIFLTDYARLIIEQTTGKLPNIRIIPHGVNERFSIFPRPQKSIKNYTNGNPFKIIYVSIVNHYKHQWHVVEAVANLREITGWSLSLELIGPTYAPAFRRLQASIAKYDQQKKWVNYHGAIPFKELHSIYKQVHLGLFASSCENMPNILLETMAAGLPIACSNRGPMPEVLGGAGVYFDPENPLEITKALKELIESPGLRDRLAKSSFEIAKKYTWQSCADQTFAFLSEQVAT